jgi:hypothetical protein
MNGWPQRAQLQQEMRRQQEMVRKQMHRQQEANRQRGMDLQQKTLRDLQKQQRQMVQQTMSGLTRVHLAGQAARQEVKAPLDKAQQLRWWQRLLWP